VSVCVCGREFFSWGGATYLVGNEGMKKTCHEMRVEEVVVGTER
jgi:hypothetical protein